MMENLDRVKANPVLYWLFLKRLGMGCDRFGALVEILLFY